MGLWVGIMLTTQPFFIAGIEDVEVATWAAFGAFFTFMFVFVLSAVGMWYDSTFGKNQLRKKGTERQITNLLVVKNSLITVPQAKDNNNNESKHNTMNLNWIGLA